MTTRKNFSKDSSMEECVTEWDIYVEGGGFLNLKAFWKRECYEEKFGIKYNSFYMYARADKTKRTALYSKTGPSSKKRRGQFCTVVDEEFTVDCDIDSLNDSGESEEDEEEDGVIDEECAVDYDIDSFIHSKDEEEEGDSNNYDSADSFIDNEELKEEHGVSDFPLSKPKIGIKKKVCQTTLVDAVKNLRLLTPCRIEAIPTLDSFEMWHLKVVCENFQHSAQHYTRRGISDIIRSVKTFSAELDEMQCGLPTPTAEMKKLGGLKSDRLVSARDIDQFLQEEGMSEKEFLAAMRREDPDPLLVKIGEAGSNALMVHFETWHLVSFFVKRVIEGHRRGLDVPSPLPFLKEPPHDPFAYMPTLAELDRMQAYAELELSGGWH